MGARSTAAVRARQRVAAARVERLIADAGHAGAVTPVGQTQIRYAVRAGRAALRRRDRARAAMSTATDEVGTHLIQLLEAGLTRREAFEALDLTVGVGRRLLAGGQHEPRTRRTASSSTDPSPVLATPGAPTERGRRTTTPPTTAGTTAHTSNGVD
jgi:hypothetical protein